jgi:dethiobiotin synthetase
MHIFITGTDTNVGKTLVSSWLCLHTGYAYFKPIQSGSIEGCDSNTVHQLSGAPVYQETFSYQAPLSPHISAQLEGKEIDISRIKIPSFPNLLIEGAGGVLVPLHEEIFMIDLIKQLAIPVIIVARSALGTINHTLLTLESLRARQIPILGVIMNGISHPESADAISHYGNTPILATLPFLKKVTSEALQAIPLTPLLQQLCKGTL